LFIIAAIHAREYTTAETATALRNTARNYDTNPDVTWMLDYHEIHIFFNEPDGRKEAEAGLSGVRTPMRTTAVLPAPTAALT
jgi:hypothetical protein